MGAIGPTQLLIIFAIVLLLFGARKLPEVGRALGTAITEFKASVSGEQPAAEAAKPAQDANADHQPGA